MGAFTKVQPGAAFRYPARTHNAFIDAADWHQRTQYRESGGRPPRPIRGGIVSVKNKTGAARTQFDAVKIGGPLIGTDGTEPEYLFGITYAGETPTNPIDQIAVLQQPLQDGEVGIAIMAGFTMANVYVVESTDEICGLDIDGTQGVYVLSTRGAGIHRVLTIPSGITAPVATVCAIELRHQLLMAAAPATDVGPGTVGTFDLYKRGATGWEAMTHTADAWNHTNITLASGCVVRLEHAGMAGQLVATPWQWQRAGTTDGTEQLN